MIVKTVFVTALCPASFPYSLIHKQLSSQQESGEKKGKN